MKFLISILIIFFLNTFASCLTFINKRLPWISAAQHCIQEGLVMESNETKIRNWLQANNVTQVWLGQYNEVTEWAYIKGCYEVNIKSSTKTFETFDDKLLCQKLCKDKKYFGVKNGVCVCLSDTSMYNSCNCTSPTCMRVWEHRLEDIYPDEDENCIAYKCKSDGTLERKFKDCDERYLITCDDRSIDTGSTQYTQIEGENFCGVRGSFLKWYTHEDCKTKNQWTSGRREEPSTENLYKYSNIDSRRLLKCHTIDSRTVSDTKKCNSDEKEEYFLCRNETAADWISPEIHLPAEYKKQGETSGATIGVVITGVVIAVITVFVLVYVKRRQSVTSSIKKTSHLSNPVVTNTKQRSKSSTLETSKNESYTRNYSLAKNPGRNYSLAKPSIEKSDRVNYSFAQPIEADDDYKLNSDYDHLNGSVKQTPESNYTYNCPPNMATDGKVGEYDHINTFTTNPEQAFSQYDHVPITAGNDPSYDACVGKVHEDSDRYDHLPPNFRAGEGDYQYTQVRIENSKNNAYDHFDTKQ